MKLDKYLSESFVTYYKPTNKRGQAIPIYKNPTSDEIRDCSKSTNSDDRSSLGLVGSVKFIIDYQEKSVYVFPGHIIHNEIWRAMNKEGNVGVIGYVDDRVYYTICGEGKYESGKIRFIESDLLKFDKLENKFLKSLNKFDWSFADKYFTEKVNDIVKNYKPDRRRYTTQNKEESEGSDETQ